MAAAEPPHDHGPMSFRSRPVLDRKHRPRWQDELRTQQLTVIAFAVAIALALGIFGATAWNGYWEAHFLPVASVNGTTYDRSDLEVRQRILVAEASARIAELQTQLGGARDQIIQQQIDQLSLQMSSLDTTATDSLVDSAVLAARADDFGVAVTDDDVDAGVAERFALDELVRAQLILVDPLPDDAEPDAEPTDDQLEAARDAAQAALDRIDGGEEFSTVAGEASDDFTAPNGGVLGWFGADDAAYEEYFSLTADAEINEIVGPVEVEGGYALLKVLARRDATPDGPLPELLERQGVDRETYRELCPRPAADGGVPRPLWDGGRHVGRAAAPRRPDRHRLRGRPGRPGGARPSRAHQPAARGRGAGCRRHRRAVGRGACRGGGSARPPGRRRRRLVRDRGGGQRRSGIGRARR